MEPIVGIICEYDPFHRGHARQFALIRERLPRARIVCVMSGCFTQRGMPALFSPMLRAQAALRAGADAVFELPCAFAVREAEHFALGGVGLLDRLGFVTHLSFGCETNDLRLLHAAADALENPNAVFTAALRNALDGGKPFAAAQAAGVAAMLGGAAAKSHATDTAPDPTDLETDCLARFLSRPNNILGISYLRALRRLQSDILPLPVAREGDYHATGLSAEGYPSASAIRKAYLTGDLRAAEAACGYQLEGARPHRPEALDAVLLHQLRGMDSLAFRALPDCSEGLENRLARASHAATSRVMLLALLKTRRYPYTRLNRLAAHALLGVDSALLSQYPLPPYARLLGLHRGSEGSRLLSASRLPILSKAANADRAHPLFCLEERAYDLWALGAGLPAGLIYREPMALL